MVGRSWPKAWWLVLLAIPLVCLIPYVRNGVVLWVQWLGGHAPDDTVIHQKLAEGTVVRDTEGRVLAATLGQNLRGADLRGADLRGADLHGRDLRDCDLRGADLTDANLAGADLRSCDATDATLTGADFTGAAVDDTRLVVPLQGRVPSYLPEFKPPPGMDWTCFRYCAIDAMPQVLIPAGEFLMGSPAGQGDSEEHPQKRVYVSAFWLDLHPVTVAQYQRFCSATGRSMASGNTADQHPVGNVSWDDATAYAQWAGRELPTEAQWEKAARGGTTTVYPWGERWDPAMANGYEGGPRATTPVGSYPPNGFGLYDMIGNVWEWCRDWFDSGWYARMPDRDPVNETGETYRVLRGGSWYIYPHYLRVAYRGGDSPDNRGNSGGFRCSAAP